MAQFPLSCDRFSTLRYSLILANRLPDISGVCCSLALTNYNVGYETNGHQSADAPFLYIHHFPGSYG